MAIKILTNNDPGHVRKITSRNGAKEYAQLRLEVTRAGILDRDYFYYLLISTVDIAGFVFFLYQFIAQKNPFLLILMSIGISFFTIRLGGLIHDAGHRAIFKSTTLNDVYGYLCSFTIAFPFHVWKYKHNAHHAHTNEVGEDPDLEIPFSFLEDGTKNKGRLMQFIQRYQAWVYYPLGSLVSFTMRFKAFRHYMQQFNRKIFFLILFQGIGMFCWYIVPFLIFPFWKALLFFILTNEISGFYMLNIFAPNHKGMPQLGKGVTFSFLEHQMITSRNIYGHWLTDYVYLGLNYQVEHHLFPNCPRNKLPNITPYVLRLSKKYKLNYVQTGILESNRFILSELKKASASIQ